MRHHRCYHRQAGVKHFLQRRLLRRLSAQLHGHGSDVWQHQRSVPNAQGYGISSCEVSTIEAMPATLLVNVSGGFDMDRYHRQQQAGQGLSTAFTCNQQTSSSQQRGMTITQFYNRTRKGKHRRLLVHQRPAQR